MEQEPQPQDPRIYIASKRCVKAGLLHGRWIDAQEELEKVVDQVAAMFVEQPLQPITEEDRFMIFATENFGSIDVPEDTPLDIVLRLAIWLPAYEHEMRVWIARKDGDLAEAVESFDTAYVGTAKTLLLAGMLLSSHLGLLEQLDQFKRTIDPRIREVFRIDSALLLQALRNSGLIYMEEVPDGYAFFYLGD